METGFWKDSRGQIWRERGEHQGHVVLQWFDTGGWWSGVTERPGVPPMTVGPVMSISQALLRREFEVW
jgi:hypothetical protein